MAARTARRVRDGLVVCCGAVLLGVGLFAGYTTAWAAVVFGVVLIVVWSVAFVVHGSGDAVVWTRRSRVALTVLGGGFAVWLVLYAGISTGMLTRQGAATLTHCEPRAVRSGARCHIRVAWSDGGRDTYVGLAPDRPDGTVVPWARGFSGIEAAAPWPDPVAELVLAGLCLTQAGVSGFRLVAHRRRGSLAPAGPFDP